MAILNFIYREYRAQIKKAPTYETYMRAIDNGQGKLVAEAFLHFLDAKES